MNDTAKKTKGAYNVCADLILSYAPLGVTHVYYTLGREESLALDGGFNALDALQTLELLRK